MEQRKAIFFEIHLIINKIYYPYIINTKGSKEKRFVYLTPKNKTAHRVMQVSCFV